jgi:hypothetical protein
MAYPDKTHGITGSAENIHLYTMIYEFLEQHLRQEIRPAISTVVPGSAAVESP